MREGGEGVGAEVLAWDSMAWLAKDETRSLCTPWCKAVQTNESSAYVSKPADLTHRPTHTRLHTPPYTHNAMQ